MSGRINRINDALANSSIALIGTVEPLAQGIGEFAEGGKHLGSAFKHGCKGSATFMKDWSDAQEDLAAVRKLERALSHDERLRAVTLNREAFEATKTE